MNFQFFLASFSGHHSWIIFAGPDCSPVLCFLLHCPASSFGKSITSRSQCRKPIFDRRVCLSGFLRRLRIPFHLPCSLQVHEVGALCRILSGILSFMQRSGGPAFPTQSGKLGGGHRAGDRLRLHE